MEIHLAVFVGAVLAAMGLTPVVSRLAKKRPVLCGARQRGVENRGIPAVGGAAVLAASVAVIVPMFFLQNATGEAFRESQIQMIVLLAAATFVFAVGFVDDLWSLSVKAKVLCLVGASIAISVSGARIESVSVTTSELQTGWLAWPLTVIWVTVITGCISLIDALDGLAAGIAAIVCGAMAFMAFLAGQMSMVIIMLAVLGSLFGFLFFNFYPARVLLGNCGSMFVGFVIGAGSVVCQAKKPTVVGLLLPFLVLGIPILDASLTMVRRGVVYRSIFANERGWLHRCLLDIGLPKRTVLILIYALTALTGGIGVFVLTVEGGLAVAVLGAGVVGLLAVFVYLGSGRIREVLAGMKRVQATAREKNRDKKVFKKAASGMARARSFEEWWEVLCEASKNMHLQEVELLKRRNGSSTKAGDWRASEKEIPLGARATVTLPFRGRGATDWEIRTCAAVNGSGEASGRKAMLLARLFDKFPPPESIEELRERLTTGLAGMPQEPGERPNPLEVIGVPVVPFETYDEAIEFITHTVESGKKTFWAAVNPQKCYRAWRDKELFDVLKNVDVTICDGVGVSIASKILNGRTINRVTGCDLFFKLISLSAKKGWGVYLLGASEESNSRACERLKKMCPDLRIVGSHSGFFEDSDKIVEQINSSNADLLFVAMGSPKQEYWLARYRAAIDVAFCMGVGGSFDVAAGAIKRAPKIFQKTGTEWLFQLLTEPRKRFKRQTVYVPYMLRVFGKGMFGEAMEGEGAKNSVSGPSGDITTQIPVD